MEYSNPLNSREKVIWEKVKHLCKTLKFVGAERKGILSGNFSCFMQHSQYFHFWIETTQVSHISYCQIHGFVTHILNMSVEMQIGKNYVSLMLLRSDETVFVFNLLTLKI